MKTTLYVDRNKEAEKLIRKWGTVKDSQMSQNKGQQINPKNAAEDRACPVAE